MALISKFEFQTHSKSRNQYCLRRSQCARLAPSDLASGRMHHPCMQWSRVESREWSAVAMAAMAMSTNNNIPTMLEMRRCRSRGKALVVMPSSVSTSTSNPLQDLPKKEDTVNRVPSGYHRRSDLRNPKQHHEHRTATPPTPTPHP